MSYPELHEGMNDHRDVRLLQQLLRDLGHNDHAIDGDFGPLTKAALISYQHQHGITDPSGVCSDQTWASLQGQFGDLEGLRRPEAVREFVQDAYGAANSSMTPADRLAQFEQAANEQLAAAGVPHVGFRFAAISALGTFAFRDWAVNVNQAEMEAAFDPTNAKYNPQDGLDTIYHESRHAEQWWLIARYKAGIDGLDAAALHAQTDIAMSACHAAVAHPILQSDATTDRAIAWYESVYGSGATHRNTVLGDVDNHRGEYRGLPEEGDAWDTGGRVQREYNALEQGAVAHPRPVLYEGSNEASEIRYLQQLLVFRGIHVTVDGDFGPNLKQAVMTFQSAHGLAVDGRVGPQVWDALIP